MKLSNKRNFDRFRWQEGDMCSPIHSFLVSTGIPLTVSGCTAHHDLTPNSRIEPTKKPTIRDIQADEANSYENLQAKVKMDDLYTDMVSLFRVVRFIATPCRPDCGK